MSAATPDPRVGRPSTVRDGATIWPLTHRGPAGGLHAHRISWRSAASAPPDPLPMREGHDWLYLLSGRLRLLVGAIVDRIANLEGHLQRSLRS